MKAIASALSALKSGKGLKGQLMRSGVGSIAVKIASTGLNLVLAIVLARLLGAEGFGVYSFIFAVVTILAIPAQMGLPNLVVRETAKAQVDERWDVIKGLWRWSSSAALAMSAVLILLGGAAALLFADRFTPLQLQTFWWAIALVPLIALGNLRGAALRGLRHVVLGQLPEFVLRPLILIALAFSGAAFGSLYADTAMLLHVCAAIGAFIIGAIFLARATPRQINREINSVVLPYWLRNAAMLGAMEASNVVNLNIGIIFVGIFIGPVEAGIFRLGYQIANFAAFGSMAMDGVLSPHFARFIARREMQTVELLSRIHSTTSMVVCILFLCIFWISGRKFIEIAFQAEFSDMFMIVIVITFGRLMQALCSSSQALLMMAGYENKVAATSVLSLVCNIVITAFLLECYGEMSAAIGASFSYLVSSVILWSACRQKIGVNTMVFPGKMK